MKAFPRQITFNNGVVKGKWIDDGMDLRDYFAAKAMQGYIMNTGILGGISPTDEDLSRYSYELADAMMEARNASTH